MVKINTKEIPNIEMKLLCSAFLSAMQKFYENPENLARFEAWKTAQAKGA